MTTSELRAAAERLNDRDLADFKAPTLHETDIRAGIILARAWLAEHPADDNEDVTEEWLRSVGFIDDPTDDDYLLLMLNDDPYPTYLTLTTKAGKYDGKQACFLTRETMNDARNDDFVVMRRETCATRGDVRRLCRALGVTLAGDAK